MLFMQTNLITIKTSQLDVDDGLLPPTNVSNLLQKIANSGINLYDITSCIQEKYEWTNIEINESQQQQTKINTTLPRLINTTILKKHIQKIKKWKEKPSQSSQQTDIDNVNRYSNEQYNYNYDQNYNYGYSNYDDNNDYQDNHYDHQNYNYDYNQEIPSATNNNYKNDYTQMYNHFYNQQNTKNKQSQEERTDARNNTYNSNGYNDRIKINANTVIINPHVNKNENMCDKNNTNNNKKSKSMNISNHKQRLNFIINNKYLVHPDINIDRLNSNELILFDKYESLLQLNEDNSNNNIFYSIKSNLTFNDPHTIITPIIKEGKIRHFKLTCQSIDITKHFITWFFHMKNYTGELKGAFIKPWNQINNDQHNQYNRDMIYKRNDLTYGRRSLRWKNDYDHYQ